ncbi:NfeD family protein [Vibrio sp. SCSIO 43136]|uniref:NfeD family protein n=1 Tax=Vibrio sp. SCSIO 43136 TaxID=2819101 RepID=UPI0020753193|nr:NfeD family protein [Vibrio sp. SCSIO 43136]USD64583.1 NfeD family protein [Vibrio sp. SCSIO 43136]
MIELLEQMNHWHWIALGLVLLGGELVGAAGYLLWIGLSAITVGLVKLGLPISWELQWISFAVISLFTTWLWWRYQAKKDRQSESEGTLNQREKQLIGQTTRLEQDVEVGRCRIRLGDTTWSAQTDQAIAAGTLVKVTAVDGILVTIEPAENN